MKLHVVQISILFLASMFAATGCRLSNDDKDKVIKITPEFSVDLFEELGDIRNFQFKIATIEKQICTNYFIDVSASKVNNVINLTIKDLVEPTECDPGNAAATATSNLGFMPNGTHPVFINLKNTIFNQGKLRVTNDACLLSLETEDGLEIVHSELKRIPAKTIWGYVGYEDKNAVGNQPEQFIQDLENAAHLTDLPNGYFGYFMLENNQDVVLSPSPAFTFFKTFLFRFDSDIQDLENLLGTYRNGPAGAAMEIKLYTWEGEVF